MQADDAVQSRLLVQQSFVSGIQHHARLLLSRIRVGDSVRLVREPGNAQDANAVRVEWQGQLIGYIPRGENSSIARQLDFGNRLAARVIRLAKGRDRDKRVELEIYLPL